MSYQLGVRGIATLLLAILGGLAQAQGAISYGKFGGGAANAVTGPGAACTDNALPRWDGATATVLQCSDALLTDAEVLSGLTGVTIGTATTADANADSLFGASATTKKALVLQAKATPTQPPFVVQQSDGTPWFSVTTDGSVIIDQRTAATFTRMLDVKFQGTTQFDVNSNGIGTARVGFNGGGSFFTTDASGNVTGLGDGSFRHHLSNGTSPTAPAGGGTCGTSAPSIAGKDSGFKLTVGSVAATSCTVTFGTAWATAPVCVANAATTTTGLNIATGTTTVTISAAALTPAEVLHVVCMGF